MNETQTNEGVRSLDGAFYVLRVPHQSPPSLCYFKNFLEFRMAYEFGWTTYQSKAELIADAGWDDNEIPEQVKSLPDGPCWEYSFGWQPSEYLSGVPSHDDFEQAVKHAIGHDMHASRLLYPDELATFAYSGHREHEVRKLILDALEK